MKKIILPSMLFAFTLSMAPSIMADPSELVLRFTCPLATKLGNSGNEIAGFGSESKVNPNSASGIYFSSKNNNNPVLPTGIPTDLSSYKNTQVSYDGTTQKVVCSYMSSLPTPPFQVSYALTNAKNARVITDPNSITLGIPVGVTQ